jgi:hypothetical protein
MNVCAWCGQLIETVLGDLSGQRERNFGMCSCCLQAHLAALPDPMGKHEAAKARRMRKSGKSLLHIQQVLGVSRAAVQAALRAA